eukprot:UN10927
MRSSTQEAGPDLGADSAFQEQQQQQPQQQGNNNFDDFGGQFQQPSQFNQQQTVPQPPPSQFQSNNNFNPQPTQLNQQPLQQQQYGQQPQQQFNQFQPFNPTQQPTVPAQPVPTTNDVLAAALMSQVTGDTSALQAAGQSFLLTKTRSWFSWLTFDPFRPYFSVDHDYIRKRLFTIIFPFRFDYQRKQHPFNPAYPHYQQQPQLLLQNTRFQQHQIAYQQTPYELPCFDHAQPDLYIPLMSLVTFMLVQCYLYGLLQSTEFDPEMMSSTATLIFFLVLI